MNDGNTSIEFVSETGPIDFSVMMQEGVKALTKILSSHIQDNPHLLRENSMKVIFKENNGKIEPVLTTRSSENAEIEKLNCRTDGVNIDYIEEDDSNQKQISELYEDYEVIEFDNEGNYHICEKTPEDSKTTPMDKSKESCKSHIDINKNNQSQLDISICPSYDPVNAESITNLGTRDIEGSAEPISSYEHEIVFEHDNGKSTKFMPPMTDENGHYSPSSDKISTGSTSDSSPAPCLCHSNEESSYRRFFKHDYPKQRPYSVPNFKALMHYTMAGQNLCPICEYYVVFGTPPKQMMRWYSSKRQNLQNETIPAYHCREHYPAYMDGSSELPEDDCLSQEQSTTPNNQQDAEYFDNDTKRSKRKKKKSKKKGKR